MIQIKKIKKNLYKIENENQEVINEFKITVKSIENKIDTTIIPILNKFMSNPEYKNSNELFENLLKTWTSYTLEKTAFAEVTKVFDALYENINIELDLLDISKFSNRMKKTKNSIFVESHDILKLMKLSYCLKFYSILFNTSNNISPELSKKVFTYLINKCDCIASLEIIYKIIEKKLSVFKLTDASMWQYILLYHSKNYETIVTEVFNFIVNILLVIYDISEEKNLITFLVVFIDQNMRWLLTDSYTTNVIFSSHLSEDTNSNSTIDNYISSDIKSDFIKICSYEDTLKSIELICVKYMKKYNVKQENFDTVITDLYITPIQRYFIVPIISNMCNIEYNFLINRAKTEIYYLQLFVYFMLMEIYGTKKNSIIQLLTYGANKPIIDSSTIKMKKISDILSENMKFYNIKNKSIFIKLLMATSVMITRKSKLVNVIYPHISNISIDISYINDLLDIYKNLFDLDKESEMVLLLRNRFIKELEQL